MCNIWWAQSVVLRKVMSEPRHSTVVQQHIVIVCTKLWLSLPEGKVNNNIDVEGSVVVLKSVTYLCDLSGQEIKGVACHWVSRLGGQFHKPIPALNSTQCDCSCWRSMVWLMMTSELLEDAKQAPEKWQRCVLCLWETLTVWMCVWVMTTEGNKKKISSNLEPSSPPRKHSTGS